MYMKNPKRSPLAALRLRQARAVQPYARRSGGHLTFRVYGLGPSGSGFRA